MRRKRETSCRILRHLMENEERSIASLPQQAQELLLDHTIVWMN
jgi:hypothetical protein